MAYRKESHLRSLIKGVTWRVLATTDTVLVVLFVTCLSGNCSLDHAIKIGFVEFFIKFVVYYFHERIWQFALKDGVVTKNKTLFKTITWRIVATTMTFLISGTILNAFDEIALYIALTELVTKFVLYYIHERMWVLIPIGKIRKFFFDKTNN